MKREQRYIVLKLSDFPNASITEEEKEIFNTVCDKLTASRAKTGKPPLLCVVVEHDWPEYAPTWQAIEARVDSAEESMLVPKSLIKQCDDMMCTLLKNARHCFGVDYFVLNEALLKTGRITGRE